ncbi:Uncharacterised protein [Paenibacillus thiaminolyticus]|nr:Uncharacterised protein [Paenibacillus thiaminolyticus]
MKHEYRIEKRIAAHVPLGDNAVHQFLERILAMLKRIERRLFDFLKVFSKSFLSGRECAQGQRVDKHPHHVREIRMRTPGYRRADNNLLVAGETRQQCAVRSQEHHINGDSCVQGQLLYRFRQCSPQLEINPVACKASQGGTREIGWQLQDRQLAR